MVLFCLSTNQNNEGRKNAECPKRTLSNVLWSNVDFKVRMPPPSGFQVNSGPENALQWLDMQQLR